ncbi:GNAT family N-acetyltransferase [Streptomyces sp. TRM66268-LWL]|uniref:GNAT family N-acetyltransferase n=1 Tax=Streptomyces polyasparticus TaxID=2767826 RepID=A0ABR7SJ60_9ACTN|nr:GNAT family N-acetyltransferase [Streptomyces polyasparticus]MBC9715536.1 GNAT family N-acetyltransferase [Streptomyces polyasparticus]
MSDLRIEKPLDDAALADWRRVHNTVIPTHPLSLADARDRAVRHVLEVAYAGDELVGCSTVRPPVDGTRTATVIARVLPGHRRRGYGTELYRRGLARARELGAETVETVVLSSNEDGLHFAERQGFFELERYTLPGEPVEWVDLRLA